MKYAARTFSVTVGSKEYRDNYDRIFGKKCECPKPDGEKLCEKCSAKQPEEPKP